MKVSIVNGLIVIFIILMNIFIFPFFYINFGLEINTNYKINFTEDNQEEVIEYLESFEIDYGIKYTLDNQNVNVYYQGDDILNQYIENNQTLGVGYYNYSFLPMSEYPLNYNNIDTVYVNQYDQQLEEEYNIIYNQNISINNYFTEVFKVIIYILIIVSLIQIILSRYNYITNSKKYLTAYLYSPNNLYLQDLKNDLLSYLIISLIFMFILLQPFINDLNIYNYLFILQIIIALIVGLMIKLLCGIYYNNKLIKSNIREIVNKKQMKIGLFSEIFKVLLLILTVLILFLTINTTNYIYDQYMQIRYLNQNLNEYSYISSPTVTKYGDKLVDFIAQNKDHILYNTYYEDDNILYANQAYLNKYFKYEYNPKCQVYLQGNQTIPYQLSNQISTIEQENICYYNDDYQLPNIQKSYKAGLWVDNPMIVVSEKFTSDFWVPNSQIPNNYQEDQLPVIVMSIDDLNQDFKINLLYPLLYELVNFIIILMLYSLIVYIFFNLYFRLIKKQLYCNLIVGNNIDRQVNYAIIKYQTYNLIGLSIFIGIGIFLDFKYLIIFLLIVILESIILKLYINMKLKKEFKMFLKE